MRLCPQRCSTRIALALFLVLLVPPVRQTLEASMTAQMLAQLPLLAASGYLLRSAVPDRLQAHLAAWDAYGVTGLVLAVVTAAYWMLPRALDTAVSEPLAAAAKYLTVPLLIGLPLGLSWPRMNFIVKGVLLLELIASCFRLGWLYLTSTSRLCNNYLLGDQQRLGHALLILGCLLLVWISYKLLWGRFASPAGR